MQWINLQYFIKILNKNKTNKLNNTISFCLTICNSQRQMLNAHNCCLSVCTDQTVSSWWHPLCGVGFRVHHSYQDHRVLSNFLGIFLLESACLKKWILIEQELVDKIKTWCLKCWAKKHKFKHWESYRKTRMTTFIKTTFKISDD